MGIKNYDYLVGSRYERLVIKEIIYVKGSHTRAKCVCDCGNEIETQLYYLLSGHTKSCGCYRKEFGCEVGKKAIKHGFVGHPLYFVFRSMIARCENTNHQAYGNYGGRGIKVCPEWHDMKTFGEWALNNGYQQGLSIDRIDNDGNYEPSNCRWVDRKTQSNNKSTNIVLEYNGKTQTLQQWSEETGISVDRLYYRYHAGKTAEEILKKYDVKNIGYTRVDITEEIVYELKKQGMSTSKMSKVLGCSQGAIRNRLKKLESMRKE